MSIRCWDRNRIPPKSKKDQGTESQLLAILNACHPAAWEQVGGVPLSGRALFHLGGLHIRKVVVLLSVEKFPVELKRWNRNLEVQGLTAREDLPKTILSIANHEPSLLYIDASHLIDARLLKVLASASETTVAYIDPEDRNKRMIRAGFLKGEDLHLWAEQGEAALICRAKSLFPCDIDPFSPEIRGPSVPHFMEVRSREEAREATRVLIRSQQKQAMDLPAQFLDPYFENLLTRVLCETRITPNLVTLVGAGIAVTVAWLFWHGYFVVGAVCTFLVEILDGVDGKLARTKLQFSRLGRYENLIDYFYENSWYVALAVGLHTEIPSPLPAMIAALLVLSDTADNILYTLAGRWYGKSIDLFGPFDRAFRRIAGRRNIYGILFIIGFSLGHPLQTFAAAAAWAFLTASIHGVRLVQYAKRIKRRSATKQRDEEVPHL